MGVEPLSSMNRPPMVKGMRALMGTFVTVSVACPDLELAAKAVELAFREIGRVADLMNVHHAGSELSQLNKCGFHDNLSPDTRRVIQRASYFSELSQGAFDITLWPVLKLWRDYAEWNGVPPEEELRKNLALVDYRNITIEDRRIHFAREGMGITLAGIAKGYAVDRAIEVLGRNGIEHALVNGGGDMRAMGGKTNDLPWTIGLLDPLNKSRVLARVALRDQAIATSGTHARSFDDVLDARTGKRAGELLSSTVIAEKAMDADVLATALLAMGSADGKAFVEKFGNAKAFFATKEGRFFESGSKE